MKIALVYFSRIGKVVFSLAIKLTIKKIALVCAAFIFKFTFTCLFAIYELADVFYFVVVPKFNSMAMLQIIVPVTFIHATFGVAEDSVAMCYTINPLALIYISIRMRHPSRSIELSILSLTLVYRSIRKPHSSYPSISSL